MEGMLSCGGETRGGEGVMRDKEASRAEPKREERGDELILLEYRDIDLRSAVVLHRRGFV